MDKNPPKSESECAPYSTDHNLIDLFGALLTPDSWCPEVTSRLCCPTVITLRLYIHTHRLFQKIAHLYEGDHVAVTWVDCKT